MPGLDKKTLSERDICTKFITPALERAGWDIQVQVREEVTFTKGRITVRATSRAGASRSGPTTCSPKWPR
jgi:type I site-specific restriction endonuclease